MPFIRARGERREVDAHRIGQRFGHWTLREFASYQCGQMLYECVCDCGTVQDVHWTSLSRERTHSCGRQGCPYQRQGKKPVLWEHDGVVQPLKAWAESVGITCAALSQRLLKGMTLAEALRAPKDQRARLVTAFGITQSVSAWARERGVNRVTLQRRLFKGWPIEKALTDPVYIGRH